jgi:hypothetical protein
MLERTLSQLDIGWVPPAQARALGQMGYRQWLGCLPAGMPYRVAARVALGRAEPVRETSPAVGVFCELLQISLERPLEPLSLSPPSKQRRGRVKARRAAS